LVLDAFQTRAEAAAVAGVGANQLARYLRGEAEPTFDIVARLAADRGVSLNWLANGEGPRAITEEALWFDAPGMVSVPVFDFHVSAGSGEVAESEEPVARIAFDRDLLVAISIRAFRQCARR
jgi:transcriptional regulator with XRE-family HTH domain